jgi:hypothetical protein
MSRLPSLVLVVAVVGGACLGVAANAPTTAEASSGRTKACESKASRTLRSSTRAVRIFRKNGKTYGCHYGRGRAYALGDRNGEESADFNELNFLQVAGAFAGYERLTTGRLGSLSRSTTINLRTGRFVRDVYNGGGPSAPVVEVTDLELRRTGSMAWITQSRDSDVSGPLPIQYEVRAGVRSSSFALLDAGPDVDPRSLALEGTTLYWTRAGVRRSAALP